MHLNEIVLFKDVPVSRVPLQIDNRPTLPKIIMDTIPMPIADDTRKNLKFSKLIAGPDSLWAIENVP